jgi:hypothetical protein
MDDARRPTAWRMTYSSRCSPNSFTGAFYCADSVNSVPLSGPPVTRGSNFDYNTLKTRNARFQVGGVSSTQCSGSEAAGLLGILASSTNFGIIGNTLHGAGALAGFVLWDPAGSVPNRRGR